MAKMEIAIDLGTSFTSIYVSGNGVVLHEPSVIAYHCSGGRRSVLAAGNEAYAMIGKVPDKTKIVCPIVDGAVKFPEDCAKMLSEFMKKILPQSYIIKPKVSAIVGVPTGVTVDERKMYEEVLMRAGIDEISMVSNIMLAAVGIELPISATYGGFIASVGGGVTDIAVVSLCGVVTGCSINIGGDMIDKTLSDSISGICQLKVDLGTVRRVREQISSLIRNDCATATVSGIDLQTKMIRSQSVSAGQIYNAVFVYYKNIIDAMQSVINTCSPAVAAEIQKNGVNIVGGGSKIPGLARIAGEKLKLRVHIPQSPQYATVLGAGKLLSDRSLLEEIIWHA
ncbi:MAG: rod shape-determining protein [Roseburia sp.]|nr:rod shape-determining protein [Roseburia sp.]